eukprot:TRINITY_DN2757_c0_g1_i1.p1 TRINITY_DN2757_c0_g1~~TRINITY_DN2757_c0_g1_i1.p1  ORF type:complete len:571 (-),score=119.97 TRINITY_DN2757_c0_g1_i1:229-1941(-)
MASSARSTQSSRFGSRADTFKATLDSNDSRRKRTEQRVQIRKSARDESLKKKRNVDLSAAPDTSDVTDMTAHLPQSAHATVTPKLSASTQQKLLEMPNWINMINSGDSQQQFEGTQNVRKMLSVEKNPPIAEVVATGIIPRFVQFLACQNFPRLQFEAAWALTNVASGTTEQTDIVVRANAVPYFIELLKSPDNDVREQSVWALGNIAGEATMYRDYILQNNGAAAMVQSVNMTLADSNAPPSLIKNSAWTISNFCRGKPEPNFPMVQPVLPALLKLLHTKDDDALTDTCWALSYLSDGENDKVGAVIESGVVPRLTELLMHSSFAIKTPALRTIGNLVTGDDSQTQAVLDCNILIPFLALMNSSKKSIKKETCWAISNITAGSKHQIQAIIDADLMPSLIRLLLDGEFDVKKEACWAVTNATSGGTESQIAFMVAKGVVRPLCKLLKMSDVKVLTVALDALDNVLKSEANSSKVRDVSYADLVEEFDGLDYIEALQQHENVDIYNKAVALLERYFSAQEDPDRENSNSSNQHVQPPNISTNSSGQQVFGFSFNAPASVPAGGFDFKFAN